MSMSCAGYSLFMLEKVPQMGSIMSAMNEWNCLSQSEKNVWQIEAVGAKKSRLEEEDRKLEELQNLLQKIS